MQQSWFKIDNADDVASPALLVYPDRIEENIRRMINIAGGVERLRPHIKTHKLAELIRLQMAHGIRKFKCATIAEAEMAAGCNAADVVLAYQPVGPNVRRVLQLVQKFPNTKFSTIADDANAIHALSKAFTEAGRTLEVMLDIDSGMHRCGVAPGPAALELYRLIAGTPGLKPGGFTFMMGTFTKAIFRRARPRAKRLLLQSRPFASNSSEQACQCQPSLPEERRHFPFTPGGAMSNAVPGPVFSGTKVTARNCRIWISFRRHWF